MRKLFSLLAIAALALNAVSCKKSEEGLSGTAFAISVSNIGSDSALITVTPSDNSAGYLSYFIDQETAGNSIETYVSQFVDFINENNIEDLADWDNYLYYGPKSYTVDNLDANTTYIAYAVAVSNGQIASPVASCKFTITEDGDDALEDGVYSISTLIGDAAFSSPNEVALVYYGDYYGDGVNDWELYIYNDTDDDMIYSEFFTELSNTTGTGTYQIDNQWTYVSGTALSGVLYVENGEYDWYGTWYFEGDDMATGEDGSITISQNGVSCNIIDCFGNTITVNYTGEIDIYDDSEEAAALSKAERHNRQFTRINMRKFSAAPAIAKDAKRVAGKILAK